MLELESIQKSIKTLDADMSSAYSQFDEWAMTDDDWRDPSWLIEKCFLQLLAIAEVLNLEELRKMIYAEYTKIKDSDKGFLVRGIDPDGGAYSPVLGRIRCFQRSIEAFFPKEESTKVTKDLLQIIRDIDYVITNKAIFRTIPSNEEDVHQRIEGILKCVFPDLKHKPVLTKPIKNFEPDTGIPSLGTLIEYKFISSKDGISTVADEIYADTRGYVSKDWRRFLYVIYETHRFRTERDWQEHLKQGGLTENTTVVVLNGEPVVKKGKRVI
ncbi:MAG TPA: hypothetical protein DCX03_02445 [Bacteroidales bacterium]|nr:hypothetical protein [Bacteroidales bacterium]